MAFKVVGLCGSLGRPSRTASVIRRILQGVETATGEAGRLIELAEEAPHLFGALSRGQLQGRAARVIRAVEQADLLIVGTPVYRASYTGALKHVFDLVDHRAFPGKPVVLAATGGTPLHGLVTEHQLRPLFGFLNALSVPTAIYAVEQDFVDFRLVNETVVARIERAVSEAVAQLRPYAALNAAREVPALAAAG